MPPNAAKLEDVISYTPASYYTDEDKALASAYFTGANGDKLLALIRKIMLPTISDPNLPIEQIAKDFFMSQVDFKNVPAEEAKAISMGLQLSAKCITGGLVLLKSMANTPEETPENRAARRAKNSAR